MGLVQGQATVIMPVGAWPECAVLLIHSMSMKSLCFLLVFSVLGSLRVWGQVSAGLHLTQDQFLPGESIPTSLRITNFSGRTLSFGQDSLWVQFGLEKHDGPSIASVSTVPVAGRFDLENSMIATKRVDLAPHYPVLDPGFYTLRATVRSPDWRSEIEAAPVEFAIISATVLWEQRFGVPVAEGSQNPPEVRVYALQQALHLQQMKLYVRVTDVVGKRVFAVYPIGPLLTFSNPERQIDRKSDLHVLYQYGARSFYYTVVRPDGELVLKQTYDYVGASRPVLAMNREGDIMVRGGVRRPALDDVPPTPPEMVAPVDDAVPGPPVPPAQGTVPEGGDGR